MTARRRSLPSSSATIALSVVALALALAACSGPTTALTSTTTSPPRTTGSPGGSTTTTGVSPTIKETLFFVRGTSLGVSRRTVSSASDPRYLTLQALFGGPSPTEAAAGLVTDIPAGSEVRGLVVRSGVATVDLSPEFVATAPAPELSARLAQVVYTLTSFPNVGRVFIKVAKTPIVEFAGVNLASGVGRSDVTAALPPVLLESPAVGDSAGGALLVSGATSMSGIYVLQLTDAKGKLLATVTNTAVPNGSFSNRLPFTVPAAQTGQVSLFMRPTAAALPPQVVTFPITLTPSPTG
jgi:Sporulation and spore germination